MEEVKDPLQIMFDLIENSTYIQNINRGVAYTGVDPSDAGVQRPASFFGATTGEGMISRVPWFSLASASWVFTRSLAVISILIDGRVRQISTSKESPNLKEAGKHIQNISKIEREKIECRLASIGITVDDVVNSHGHRMFVNLHEITEWMETVKRVPFSSKGLFDL